MSNVIESWFEEYAKESVKYNYRQLFKRFLEWAKLNAEDLVKEWKTLMLKHCPTCKPIQGFFYVFSVF